jgi:amidase
MSETSELRRDRVHAFTDDALGRHDAVGLARLIRDKAVSPQEAVAAAIERARAVEDRIHAIQVADYDRALTRARAMGPDELGTAEFAGVPTFIKDNVQLRGLPTGQGSRAYTPAPATADDEFVAQFLAQGVIPLGKSKLPEFGFNASTEYDIGEATRNPWNTDYSAGGSSGGAAALVAAGVVPIAHGNDGGGSIRIPAAACGLVGLKPSRGRVRTELLHRTLPVSIVVDGVLTRSVRDTAHFLAAAERTFRHKRMQRVGLVEGPAKRRLRIGVIHDSVLGDETERETRATVDATAELLSAQGHFVTDVRPPVDKGFADDFLAYWGMLSTLICSTGRYNLGRDFGRARTDNLTRGLDAMFRRIAWRAPAMVRRLRRSSIAYERFFESFDLALSPVLGHLTPPIGYLSPNQPYEQLIERLVRYVSFTPLNNASGAPAISLPMGSSAEGLPIGVQLLAGTGNERGLLEAAYELEAARPFRQIFS